MSIGYNSMYNITAGIFTVFSARNPKTKSYNVNHKEEKREKMKVLFPVRKYNDFTKENFIIYNLYINFKDSPSSLSTVLAKLNTVNDREALKFKNEILNYKKLLKYDINRINSEENNISIDYMLNEYRKNKIYWFTLYFYILHFSSDGFNHHSIISSRINKKIVENIQKLLLYVSFSDNSIKEMTVLFDDRISI